MSDFSSFAEALEKKIRQEIQGESDVEKSTTSREIQDEAGYEYLGWLMGQASTFKSSMDFQRSPYTRFRTPPKPRPSHQMTPPQLKAFHQLRTYNPDFRDNFNFKELKQSYRKALLLVHPDKGGQAQVFWQVQEAYSVLQKLV